MPVLRPALALSGLLLSALGSPVSAQGALAGPSSRLLDSARVLIAKAAPAGDLETLHAAQALLERALTASPNDPWLLHYLGFAIYREATVRMGRDRSDVGMLLDRADSILERSAQFAPIPESHALRSGTLGMMIGSSPIRGMTLGPKSGAQMDRALGLGPQNPRVWLLRGIGAFNTPTMFGGGMDRAEEYLKKSIELFATDRPQPPSPSWGLSEAHTWLGRVYAREGKADEARASYERALALEPNDRWIRMVLMPALDRRKQ